MFSGEIRVTGGAFYRTFTITTAFQNETDYETIKALIESDDLPLTASGDLVKNGPISVVPDAESWTPVQYAGGYVRQAKFTLIETTTIVPPDTSAVPYAFFRRGVGYFTDADLLIPAGVDDLLLAWRDSSGNDRHATSGNGVASGGDDNRPTLIATNEIEFGSNPDGANGRSGFHLPNTTLLTELTMMISVRSYNDPPATGDGPRALFTLAASGGQYTYFPDASGHIQEGTGRSTQVDQGDPATDLTGWNVYEISASNVTLEMVSRLNNTILHTETFGGGTPFVFNGGNTLGIEDNSFRTFQGRVKDVVMFDALLTTAQRLAWYNYMSGATSIPPL